MEIVSQIIIVITLILLAILVFKTSQFKIKTQTLTMSAMLILIAIVLGTSYLTISLPIFGPNSFEIKFDTIPIMFTGIIFGPAWGYIAGFLTDILQLLVSGVAFPYFGFTLNLVLTGVIAGTIFSKRNKLPLNFMSLLTQGFIAILTVVAIMYLALTNSITIASTTHTITTFMKITIGLLLFALALLTIIALQWTLKKVEDDKEKQFLTRFAMVVVLCETLIQMILTSLWLSIMFKVPWIIYMAPRIIEAVIMIFIYIFVGQLLYRLVFKRFINQNSGVNS